MKLIKVQLLPPYLTLQVYDIQTELVTPASKMCSNLEDKNISRFIKYAIEMYFFGASLFKCVPTCYIIPKLLYMSLEYSHFVGTRDYVIMFARNS